MSSALSDRDTNIQMASSNDHNDSKDKKSTGSVSGEENKIQRTLEQRIAEQNNSRNGTYISPSDAILSPASQKLAGFKQRQINKQSNNKNPTSRSLFSRTASSTSTASLEDSEDVTSTAK